MFTEAQNCTMPFGKHKGKTLDQIANITPAKKGLGYLVWLGTEAEIKSPRLKDAVTTFLNDDGVLEEIRNQENRGWK